MAKIPETPHAQEELSLKTEGQRHINIIWEITQAIIALAVTTGTLYTSIKLSLINTAGETASFSILSNAFFLVIGFYFGRTNHTKTGGIGGNEVKDGR